MGDEAYPPTRLGQKTVIAQREFMRHLRSCPDCDMHGRRCAVAQDMVDAILTIARQEADDAC